METAENPRKKVAVSPKRSASATRVYRGVGLEVRQQERREKLLAAGLKVIGEVGYSAATVKAVCAEAGLTERYFYEGFANGEALLAAVYEGLIAELRGKLLTEIAKVPANPPALIKAALTTYFRFNSNPHIARIVLLEILGISPTIDALYRKAMDEFAGIVTQIAEPLVAGRKSADYDLHLVAHGLVGTTVHIAMQWYLGQYQQPLSTVVGSAIAIFDAVQARWLKDG